MSRDELDERLRRAAESEPVTIDRIVRTALDEDAAVSPRASSLREWPSAFSTLTVCLVAAVAIGVWWYAQHQARPAATGVYRVEAVAAGPAGVYRADAIASPGPSRVISLKEDDGATWIFSTTPDDEWLPAGKAIVIGMGERR
jgi:threonine dehydrogenase-like Zn-dependent dehydrogenase